MHRKFLQFFAIALALLLICSPALIAGDRKKAPDSEKWNLTEIFPNDEAWYKAKDELKSYIPKLAAFQGKISQSPEEMLKCMEMITELSIKFRWLRSYASMNSDLDTRNAKAQEMKATLGPLGTEFGASLAWMDPEILSIPEEKLEGFFKAAPGLENYRPSIKDTLRSRAHTLSPAEEKIMANTGLLSGAAGSAYSLFTNAELPRATVILSDGEKVTLDASAYTYYRGVPNRWDREYVFRSFFGNLNEFRGTLGNLLNSEVKTHLFTSKVRNYKSNLAAALHGPNVPTDVYYNLIKNVNKNLPVLHRYLKLRKRIMGLDQLRYSDLYASIIKDVDVSYTVPQATAMVLDAVKPLGEEYVQVLGDGFKNRWVDWHPAPGKRSGAYSNGSTYGLHPFVLMNFTGTYEEVSTLAHEMGHAMHSYYSSKDQHFSASSYKIFVAEVASTCNEHLLMHDVLKNTTDDNMRLFLLGNYIDGIRQTLFRQTQFAEFELKVNEMVEKGMALTGDNLNQVYKKILDKYYGVEEGVTVINPVCNVEWAYIPHFYYNFYVYSYSTSITASTAISQSIIEGKPDAVKNYRKFLGLGGSLPPVEELKIAGVDMTTDEPFTITMRAMNKAMDEMEAILDRIK